MTTMKKNKSQPVPSVNSSPEESQEDVDGETNSRRTFESDIHSTAKRLSSKKDFDLEDEEVHFDSDSGVETDTLENDDALAELHYAATQRKDLDRAHRKSARTVDPVYGKDSAHAIPADGESSQKDVMWRMMRALNNADEMDAPTKTAALEKKISRLHSNGKQALSVPLPAPAQGRIERAAAYDETNERIGQKWGRIVQKNRKAKQLVFPFNSAGSERGGNTSAIVHSFKPNNNYEEEIQSLLREAGVSTEKEILKKEESANEDLTETAVSKEDLLKRRHELAKMRSLMFDYERKMKRIKKIKSKKYRRVMKKEKEKLSQTMGDSDDERARSEKAEQRRVEERMTLRHKNTSKWVRRQLRRKEGSRNSATKAAIEEQLRIHDELKRRQEGELHESDSSESENDDVDRSNASDIDEETNNMRKELTPGNTKERKGLMGMRFMKEATEKKRKRALALLDSIGDESEEEEPENAEGRGRQVFSGEVERKKSSKEKNRSSVDPAVASESHRHSSSGSRGPASGETSIQNGTNRDERPAVSHENENIGQGFTTSLKGRLAAEENPWISGGSKAEDSDSSKLKDHSAIDDESKTPDPFPHEIGDHAIASRRHTSPWKSERVPSKGKEGPSQDSRPGHTGDSKRPKKTKEEVEEKGPALVEVDEALLRMQDISQAFAGAGGAEEADFESAKQSEVERGMPTAKSLQAEVLPGWGAWDGAGMPKAKRRRVETPFARAARERLEAARQAAANKRGDRKMRHVILNEKRVKQATDLTLSSIPFPFTSREQWEREVDTSVSKEMVPTAAFRDAVRKRVVAKPGSVIKPIKTSGPSHNEFQRGKRGIIDLRKKRSETRSKSRRGLMA